MSFSLVTLRIHSIPIMPRIRNQEWRSTCTIHATLGVMEILLRQQFAHLYQVFKKTLSWNDVQLKYELKMMCDFNSDFQGDKCWGRLFGVLDTVQDEGVVDELQGQLYKIRSWKWVDLTFEQACEMLAAGIPLLSIVRYYPHMLKVKENDVYSTKGYPPTAEYHVIVLVGGHRENNNEMFWFMDSHGEQSQTNGIAKVFADECFLGFGIIEI